MKILAGLAVAGLIFTNSRTVREERFYDVPAAEAYLKQTNECRVCRLHRSELSMLDLKFSQLEGADLSGTDLNGSDLTSANLRFVSLRRADLSEVLSLQSTDLSFADLRGANIRIEKLTEARLCRTTMPDGSLSSCD